MYGRLSGHRGDKGADRVFVLFLDFGQEAGAKEEWAGGFLF